MRSNHLVTDDPATPLYGGPGEAPSSLELFLSGIVSCAVLMLERIAHAEGRTLGPLRPEIDATAIRSSAGSRRREADHRGTGIGREEAGQLAETFNRALDR